MRKDSESHSKPLKSQRIGSSMREGIRLTALQSQYVKRFSSPSEFSWF